MKNRTMTTDGGLEVEVAAERSRRKREKDMQIKSTHATWRAGRTKR